MLDRSAWFIEVFAAAFMLKRLNFLANAYFHIEPFIRSSITCRLDPCLWSHGIKSNIPGSLLCMLLVVAFVCRVVQVAFEGFLDENSPQEGKVAKTSDNYLRVERLTSFTHTESCDPSISATSGQWSSTSRRKGRHARSAVRVDFTQFGLSCGILLPQPELVFSRGVLLLHASFCMYFKLLIIWMEINYSALLDNIST